jgi:hypothetical protein
MFVFLLLLQGSAAVAPCPSLTSIFAYQENPEYDPEKFWTRMSGDCYLSALQTGHLPRTDERDYLVALMGIASLVIELDAHSPRLGTVACVCNQYSFLLKQIVTELFRNRWGHRFREVTIGSREEREGRIRTLSWVITPFWNLDLVCRDFVSANFQLHRIVLLEKIFRSEFIVGNSDPRRTNPVTLPVGREEVLNTSVARLVRSSFSHYWQSGKFGGLRIVFDGEPGEDGGGLYRDWSTLIMREFVDREMLVPTEDGSDIFTINGEKTIHEDYWKMLGIVLGLSLIQDTIIPFKLSVGFFKVLLNEFVEFDDLKSEYPNYHRNLNSLDFEYQQFFIVTDARGAEIELIPGGSEMTVSAENLTRFQNLMANWKLVKSVSTQLGFFKIGFDVILANFNTKSITSIELQGIMCQSREPTLADLDRKIGLQLSSTMTAEQDVIWRNRMARFLNRLADQKKIGDFLQFVSGMRVVDSRKINIEISTLNDEYFPTSSTCTRTLRVPNYSSDEIFFRKMDIALANQGGKEFGFI